MPPRHLYLHVPFCARRCAYCDFAIAVRSRVPVADYVDGVERELSLRWGAASDWTLDTLYLGGGTPSRLGGEGVARAIAAVRSHAALAPGAEVTIEANPEDVTADAARAWREAGVNRVSLGVQSFDDDVLRWMHRVHGAGRAREAVGILRGEGIADLSVDLIFALPPEVPRDWTRDLAEALALEPTHLSLYGLTVEDATPLARWRERGEVGDAPEERYEREFLEAHACAAAAGLEHYEVSNFGRPGKRARHNSSYWTGAAYAGLGPSAHEFDGERRRWNVGPYAGWLLALREGKDPVEGVETLTIDNRAAEAVYLGLRTVDGLRLRDGEDERVRPWLDAGWARLDGGVLRLTPHGWLRMDALAASLTDWRSRW